MNSLFSRSAQKVTQDQAANAGATSCGSHRHADDFHWTFVSWPERTSSYHLASFLGHQHN
ncbi:MAG: hypothetical protein Q8N44_18015 [Rubrivivax sp.]|nr:hypothetical protein [Rubrivivax sp.]